MKSSLADLEQKFELLLGNFSHLEPRLKHIECGGLASTDRISVHCSYIAFRDGEVTVDEFLQAVSQLIIPFCLPRPEIHEAKTNAYNADHVTAGRIMTELSEKANRLFIRAKKGSHRSGEAGEIVLYTLNEWVLKAPQIVSKMYLKTNNNMPVHGTDGIHARYDQESNVLNLYWGESKCHKTLSSALNDALSSISDFVAGGQEKREIQIVSDHINLGEFGADAQEAILEYLDPYSKLSNDRRTVFSCLLVFNSPKFAADFDVDQIEEHFVNLITKKVNKFISSISASLDSANLASKRFEFFLVPVPCVEEFRDGFQKLIGWPDA